VYNIIRKDREGSHHGGGVAAFVKRSLCIAEVVIDDLYTNLELLCFDVFIQQCSLRFFLLYTDHHTVTLKPLITWICLSNASNSTPLETELNNIVTGDFNCPRIDYYECPW